LPRVVEFNEFKVTISIVISLKKDTFIVNNNEVEVLGSFRSCKNPVVLASCVCAVSFAEVLFLVALLKI
jgi:hypothetical protein